MKIALVILHADPARGGAERYTIDLAHELARRGEDVWVLASTFSKTNPPLQTIELKANGLTRAARYDSFLNSLDRHLDASGYDMVHTMLPVRRCDIYHPHAGIAADAVLHGHEKHSGALRRGLARLATRMNRRRQRFAHVERELLSRSEPPIVLCLSEYVKQTVRKHYGLPEEKLATLFNGVDLTRFDRSERAHAAVRIRQQFHISNDRVVALMIAQDFERKGLRQAIAAVARLNDPRLVLLVVGKQESSPYQNLAISLGIADRVVFAGPTSDPTSFYRAADFFVLPTRHDPCSLVVLEALAMGLPVISTRSNGACEIMQNGVHGFVLDDPSDIDALSMGMQRMLDAQKRSEMSSACLQLRPSLSNNRHVDHLLQIYAQAGSLRH